MCRHITDLQNTWHKEIIQLKKETDKCAIIVTNSHTSFSMKEEQLERKTRLEKTWKTLLI